MFCEDIGIDPYSDKSIDEQLNDQLRQLLRPKTEKDWKQYYYLKREKKKQKYFARIKSRKLK